jgi:hypothetical protein
MGLKGYRLWAMGNLIQRAAPHHGGGGGGVDSDGADPRGAAAQAVECESRGL